MEIAKNSTAIITGAGSGIGRGFAKELTARGVRVLITDINLDAAKRVADECGNNATACLLDVRNSADVQSCVEDFVRDAGRLDYMFNNAAVGVSGETYEIPLQAWQYIIDANLMGVLHGVLAAYPIMIKQGSGHIINTASLAGLGPAPLMAPYGMTKHAVVGLSKSLRIEAAAHGVKVSALCPAAIETPFLDVKPPPGIPIPWVPDMRRFVIKLGGGAQPYPVEKCVKEALSAIEANQALIVLPGRARFTWRMLRWFPWLVEKISLYTVAEERSHRKEVG